MAGTGDHTEGTAGRFFSVFMGDINYNQTTATRLFSLPANCIIVGGQIIGQYTAASNSTNGYLQIGISPASGGLGTEYLDQFSVTATGMGSNFISHVPWKRFGSQNSNSWGNNSANKWTVGSNTFDVSGNIVGTVGAGAGPWTIVFEVVTI